MSLDLININSILTGLFCRIDVPDYDILRFSDWNKSIEINGEMYNGLGSLVSISASTSEIRSTSSELSIAISGIPTTGYTSISDILNNKIKGSAVQVYRYIIEPPDGSVGYGNVIGRFQGIVNNYSLEEDWSQTTATNTIVLTCASTVEILSNKVNGRRTNPTDQKALYPDDLSMDRVLKLSNSNFNFGAPV